MKKLLWCDFFDFNSKDSDMEFDLPIVSINDIFNLFILKTNFEISEADGLLICEVPGVELLTFISKYQIVIGIAELFDINEVKKNIETALIYPDSFTELNSIKCENSKKLLLERRDEISVYKHWAILMAPNGEMKSIFSDQHEEFMKGRENLETYRNTYKGIIISSEG